jgi:hypothetical protein
MYLIKVIPEARRLHLIIYLFISSYEIVNKNGCYIDRCDLWGFIREINSGISHVRYQFSPWENRSRY